MNTATKVCGACYSSLDADGYCTMCTPPPPASSSSVAPLAPMLDDVERRMGKLFQDVGIKSYAEFFNMTVAQVEAALARGAWCARHGGHRMKSCGICRRLGQ